MKKIYIAGSFANKEEKAELQMMIDSVRRSNPDAELFIPMEHFIPGGNDKDENGNWIMPNDVWGQKVYEMDLEALNSCDEMVALYRGRVASGSGTAWEIGYMCGMNKVLRDTGKPTKKITLYVSDTCDIASVMVINSVDEVHSRKAFEQK